MWLPCIVYTELFRVRTAVSIPFTQPAFVFQSLPLRDKMKLLLHRNCCFTKILKRVRKLGKSCGTKVYIIEKTTLKITFQNHLSRNNLYIGRIGFFIEQFHYLSFAPSS